MLRQWGEIWRGGGDPHRCNVSLLQGEKPQNLPLSNLNNRRFALHRMLPVNHNDTYEKSPSLYNPNG